MNLAQSPIIGRLVIGDCLDVLRTHGPATRVPADLILTDPPYNTGRQFTYDDAIGSSDAWLDFMAARLAAARDVLAVDGALVIHIDEHQHAPLRGLLNRLFGEHNCLGEIVWDKLNPKGDAGRIACQHETILAYARDHRAFIKRRRLQREKPNARRMMNKADELIKRVGNRRIPDDLKSAVERYALPIDVELYRRPYGLDDARRDYRHWLAAQPLSGGERAYRHLDEHGRIYRTVSMAWPNKRRAPDAYFRPLKHPLTGKPCPVPLRGWRNPPATMDELLVRGLLVFGDDESKQPERKYFLDEHASENLPSVIRYGGSDDHLLRTLGIPFDNPKPVGLTRQLITAFCADGGNVLDPFAGSGTVGHACLELRAQGLPYHFTLVQSPEPLGASKPGQEEAARRCLALGKAANIASLTEERLQRCLEKLQVEYGLDGRFETVEL